jgi:ElaB/YqjD/DUF883 family membrane-anchored ribosome-binding protein
MLSHVAGKESKMNDTMQNNEARDTADLLDPQGRVIRQSGRSGKDVLAQAEDYIREKPVNAALIALAIGYVMGRLRLII